MSGSGRLPYGTLASGADGIKEAISGFEDAYVILEYPYLPYLMIRLLSQPEVRHRERAFDS